jgi:Tfp pilus assembly protein PilF
LSGKTKYFLISYLLFACLLVGVLIGGKPFPPVKYSKPQTTERSLNKLGYLNLKDGVQYVGMLKCKECHADIYQSYLRTGMGKSWGLANPYKSAADLSDEIFDQKSGFYYRPFWEGNKMKVEEYRISDGMKVFTRTETVDYVVGSGQHTNSHLRLRNGYLTQVPFTYYTQLGILDFPPGFEDGHNARFTRKIGFECVSCHNSYPVPVQGSVNKYRSIPLGINCERCHGPGELHVKAMKASEFVDIRKDIDYTIVNSRKLPNDLQIEVCSRCHNQGNAVLKEGKTFFDYKPGMRVTEVFDVFRERYENDEDAFWMESHPERMKRSKCYIFSYNHPDMNPMNCSSCHKAHISFTETPLDTFKAKCITCHNQQTQVLCKETPAGRQLQSDNCIKCHMVKSGSLDIPHVIISDHHIRVTDKWKGPIRSTKDIQTGNFLGLKCMSNDKPDKLIMAKAFLLHYEKFNSLSAILDSAFYYLSELDKEVYLEDWIHFYYLKGNSGAVTKLIEQSKRKYLKSAVSYYHSGQSYANLGAHARAIYYFGKSIDMEPFNLDYRNKLGTSLLSLNRFDDAKKQFEYVINEDQEMILALNSLGFVCLVRNELPEAEKYFLKALSVDPDYLPAQLNFAKIYIAKGRLREAGIYLTGISKKHPADKQVKQLLNLVNQELTNN